MIEEGEYMLTFMYRSSTSLVRDVDGFVSLVGGLGDKLVTKRGKWNY
jgi:hypothetical protein